MTHTWSQRSVTNSMSLTLGQRNHQLLRLMYSMKSILKKSLSQHLWMLSLKAVMYKLPPPPQNTHTNTYTRQLTGESQRSGYQTLAHQEENQCSAYVDMNMGSLGIFYFKKACLQYRPHRFVLYFLLPWVKVSFGPPRIFILVKTCLSACLFMQWKMWFSDEALTKLHTLSHTGRRISGVQLSHKILRG